MPIAFISGISDSLSQFAQDQSPLLPFILLLSIVVPAAVAVSMAISGSLSDRAVRIAGAFGFLTPGLISIFLSAVYLTVADSSSYAFVLKAPLGLERFGIFLHLGLNGISFPFYLMAGIVGIAAGLYAIQSGVERLRLFLILLLIMQSGLMGIFASIDVFFFYFFHEFALIPTFIMIAIWGRSGRKGVALELTIYLTLGAMVTLAGLIALYYFSGATSFNMIELRNSLINDSNQGMIFGLLLIGFGILVSLFPFHTWAPRGYATAPTPAAMLHAGVLKKFGLYGLIQLAWPILPVGFVQWAPLLMWLALGNIILIGFVTMAQRDLKLMLGNASVMHMGYAFLGLYAYSAGGIGAAIMMLFAHGLSVSLLFLLADVVEKRAQSTDFEDLGGMGQQAPVLMGLFVAATMASIGLPGFANFWGELGIFVSLGGTDTPWVLYAAVAGIVISAVYGLRAVARIFFGETRPELADIKDITFSEKLPAVLLLISLFVIGIWPRTITDSVDTAVSTQFSKIAPAKVEVVQQPSVNE